MARETIIIDGVRYYADRPRSCRGCYFWKNRKAGCEAKRVDDYRRYEAYFREELEIPILIQGNRSEKETLEGILDLLAETCSSKRKMIRIAGDDKPIEIVKSRLMKLNSLHIQYVLDCLKENTTYVRDMKQYLLTTLFNAPVTIDPCAEVPSCCKSVRSP